MSEPISTPAPDSAPAQETPAERTFTQAEVETLVNRRVAKATKGMPGEEELTAFRAWKESQQTEREKWDDLIRERDESKAALAQALDQVERFQREKLLLSKGVSADDVDYYAFKIGKMVTETTDFQKAAELYLKDHPPAGMIHVEAGAPLGAGTPPKTENEMMNSLIRGARK